MKALLGGIRIPMVPPAAMDPKDSAGEYLYSRISGQATAPIVVVVAMLDPHTAENAAHPTIVAMARPPGRWPNHLYALAYASWVTSG